VWALVVFLISFDLFLMLFLGVALLVALYLFFRKDPPNDSNRPNIPNNPNKPGSPNNPNNPLNK
jgi:uncharacterized membrane protein YfcA